MNDAVAPAVADRDREPVPLAHHFDDPEQQHELSLIHISEPTRPY